MAAGELQVRSGQVRSGGLRQGRARAGMSSERRERQKVVIGDCKSSRGVVTFQSSNHLAQPEVAAVVLENGSRQTNPPDGLRVDVDGDSVGDQYWICSRYSTDQVELDFWL
ncbi:Uncharacterized protein HZ326_3791 [Fusarium oxysporum f. sp. albedinis]|nr:Uncharacterized protein HZ326_3791 [Fusarium oxysporum f. sp. albedinis]